MANRSIYLDFEADSAARVISIGAIDSYGNTFYSLVKRPKHTLSKRLVSMLQITSDDLVDAPSFEEVMLAFGNWLNKYNNECEFYTWGDEDVRFLAHSIRFSLLPNSEAEDIAFNLATRLVDASKLCGSRGLKTTYEELTGYTNVTHHNALIDAEKLKVICEYYNIHETQRNFRFLSHYKVDKRSKIIGEPVKKCRNYVIKATSRICPSEIIYFRTMEDAYAFAKHKVPHNGFYANWYWKVNPKVER